LKISCPSRSTPAMTARHPTRIDCSPVIGRFRFDALKDH
jgi:hypothetical protein